MQACHCYTENFTPPLETGFTTSERRTNISELGIPRHRNKVWFLSEQRKERETPRLISDYDFQESLIFYV